MSEHNANINASGTVTAPLGVFDNLTVGDTFTTATGVFTESLTISGIPVDIAGGGSGGAALTVRTTDSNPTVADVDTIVVTAGTLVDDGSGQVTIDTGGSGGGSSLTVQEQDGNPTVTGVNTIKVTDGSLIDEGNGVISLTTTSGSSSSGGIGQIPASGTKWDPFLAPASGTIYDDEFVEGTVISGSEAWGGWTVWDPGSTAITIETFPQGGGLHMRKTNTSDDIEFMGIYKPIPTESKWEAVTYVHLGATASLAGADSMHIGFAFFEDAAGNPSTTDFIFQGIVMDSGGYSVQRALFSDYADDTPASTSIDTDGGNVSPNGVFLRAVARDAGNSAFDLSYSYDGFGWKSFPFYTFPFTVSEIGIVCSNALTTSLMNYGARFFRIDPHFAGTGRRAFPVLGNYLDPTGGGGGTADPLELASISATESLTISGVPVSTGTAGGSFLTVQDQGGNVIVNDVDTIKVTDYTLTDDGGGTVSIATGGSFSTITAASGSGRWDPLMPPAVADSSGLDDEFEGTLDISTKWTVFDPDAALSSPPHTNGPPKRMTLDFGTNQYDIVGITQPYSETDGDIHLVTHVMPQHSNQLWSGDYNHDHWAGMFLIQDTGAPTTTNILFFGINMFSGPAALDEVRWDLGCWEFDDREDTTPSKKEISQTTSDHAFAGGTFLRLKWDGTNNAIRADWSKDGRGWNTFADIDIDTDTTMTSFNAVGLCGSRRDGFMDRVEFSFFRADSSGNIHGIGEPMPAGELGAVPESLSTISGSFSESLTISGVPVSTGTGGGAGTLQDAYDGGDGTIAVTPGKPFHITGEEYDGDLEFEVTGSGKFSESLQVGSGTVFIDGDKIQTPLLFVDGTQISTDNVVPVNGFTGATVKITSNQTVADVTNHIIAWDTVTQDTGGWVDLGADNTIITVPEGQGITHVRAHLYVNWETSSTATRRLVQIQLNGSNVIDGVLHRNSILASDVAGGPHHHVTTKVFAVAPGDTLSTAVWHQHGSDLDIQDATANSATWFCVEQANPVAISGTNFTSISGSFAESLTISGVPVSTGTGGGIAEIPDPLTVASGIFTDSLTVSGVPVNIEPAAEPTTISGIYSHVQSVAADTWTITHNLDTDKVNYIVLDDAGSQVQSDDFTINSTDEVQIGFVNPRTGVANIFAGIDDAVVGGGGAGGGGGALEFIGSYTSGGTDIAVELPAGYRTFELHMVDFENTEVATEALQVRQKTVATASYTTSMDTESTLTTVRSNSAALGTAAADEVNSGSYQTASRVYLVGVSDSTYRMGVDADQKYNGILKIQQMGTASNYPSWTWEAAYFADDDRYTQIQGAALRYEKSDLLD